MKLIWIVFIIGMAATLAVPSLSWEFSIAAMILILFCFGFLVFKLEGFRKQISELKRLRAAYDQLDQQAKILIKTDLELHQTQEQLDRRYSSLMSLHSLGQDLKVSVAPDEVFSKLSASLVSKFGFSKGLLGVCGSKHECEWKSSVGISQTALDKLTALLHQPDNFKTTMDQDQPRVIHASLIENEFHQKLIDLFDVPLVAVCPIKPQAGSEGLLILGRQGSTTDMQADEELVAILVNYFEMTIENAALFEDAWRGKQVLEKKVKERTQELDQANKALMALNEAKSDFVSAVSHELRTPLAAIKGYASLLVTGSFGALEEKQLTRLQKIEKHADILTQLINNMLDIARIESGRVTMEMSTVEPNEFFNTVMEMVKPQMDQKSINFQLELNALESFEGDPQQLQRVFMNLLSNAVKYTPEHGTIRIELSTEEDSILAKIQDNGCGISEHEIPKLFDEFFRSSDPINQTIRGTGLGLSLVKRIINAHHGKIWVTSVKGSGSIFYIKIPLKQEKA